MPIGVKRYMNLGVFSSRTGEQIYRNIKYPEIPIGPRDYYLYASELDRYDLLANRFYGDQSLWWIISIANANNELNSLFPPTGKRIRIPANPTPILNKFSEINNIPITFDYVSTLNTKTIGQSKITFSTRLTPEEREFKIIGERQPNSTNMRLSDVETAAVPTTPPQTYRNTQTQMRNIGSGRNSYSGY